MEKDFLHTCSLQALETPKSVRMLSGHCGGQGQGKLLVPDVFGSVTQYWERTGREERAGREGEHGATLSIQTARDLSLPPAQGLMGGIFAGVGALARLHSAYYPLLRLYSKVLCRVLSSRSQ